MKGMVKMQTKKLMQIFTAATFLCMSSGCAKSCEACEDLKEIVNEINECRTILDSPEYNGNNEGSEETLDEEQNLSALLSQYKTLSKHECDAKVENVKDMEYTWVDNATGGTYTGEWKSFGPSGTGSYVGTNLYPRLYWDREGCTVEYTGEWEYGVPNGYGKYSYYQGEMGMATVNKAMEYEGDFVDGAFEGNGTLTVPYGLNSYFNVNMSMNITGTFSKNNLVGENEYYVYDSEGNLFDHGYVDERRTIIQSERADKYEEEQRKENERITQEVYKEFGKGLWDLLW